MASIPQLQSYEMPDAQQLPANTARWRIDPRRAVPLVHDQLILCGVYAHIGVLMTVVESFSNDIETFLVAMPSPISRSDAT